MTKASSRFFTAYQGAPIAVLVALLSLSGVPSARAQGNYQAAPLGGRSALLGGTGVVLGVDGAAPFLNPATMTRIEDRSIAFSSKFYRYSQRTLDRWQQPGPVDPALFGDLRLDETEVIKHELQSVPDTTCFFTERGPGGVKERARRAVAGSHKFALCLGRIEENLFSVSALPFYAEPAGRRVSRAQSLMHSWTRWSGGPVWAYNVTNDLAVGASLDVARARYERSLSVSTITEDTSTGAALGSIYLSGTSGSSLDMLSHFGATYRLSDVFSVGLSVRTPSVHIYDEISATSTENSGAASSATSSWAGEGSFVAALPARISAGVSAEFRRVRVELNGFFYTGTDELARADIDRREVRTDAGIVTARGDDRLSLIEAGSPILNAGLGVEVFFASDLSLLLGMVTDFNALSGLSAGMNADSRLFYDRKSAIHGGVGLVSYTDYGDLVLGVRADYGWGEMAVVNAFVEPARMDPVDYKEVGVMLVLAGRLSLRTVKEAARDLGDAVEGEASAPAAKPKEPMRKPLLK